MDNKLDRDLFLRATNMGDSDVILEWRNDAVTRNNSFSKSLINRETHMKWFANKLSDDRCLMYIMMDDKNRVGHIRVDIVDNVGEISYMISPMNRGKGYGKVIISMLEEVMPENVKVLVGIVSDKNISSQKCFITNGYTEILESAFRLYIKIL